MRVSHQQSPLELSVRLNTELVWRLSDTIHIFLVKTCSNLARSHPPKKPQITKRCPTIQLVSDNMPDLSVHLATHRPISYLAV